MKQTIFKGVGTALVTPFINDNINYDIFKKFIEFQIQDNVDALIVCGTTGESATMTVKERQDTIKFVVKTVNHRVPVIAGTGSNNTKDAIDLTKFAENVGTDGVLIVTPYYNKTTQNGLLAHYEAIANSTNLPIILYNVPSRTGLNIEPATCSKLSKISNIVAIKEASGNISQIAKIRELCDSDFNIYSGNDDQIVPILSLGGIGAISVLSNLTPKYLHDMIFEYFDGNIYEPLQKQLKALPLINALFCETNPTPIKYALKLINYNFGNPRLPLIEPCEENKKLIEKELVNFGLSIK